jgi:hypothetical protein
MDPGHPSGVLSFRRARSGMRRRDFITALWRHGGGRTASCGVGAAIRAGAARWRADRTRGKRVARYLNELREMLRSLGWIEGKNLRVDHRAAADLAGMRSHALELANLGAELVVTYSTPATTRSGTRHAAYRSCSRPFPIRRHGLCGWPLAAGRSDHRLHQLRTKHGQQVVRADA